MVTKRPAYARLAIKAFRRQTYRERELVVVDNSADGRLSRTLEARNDPMLRTVRVEPGVSLGVLRNVAVEHARGRFVCTWDDDDLYHPQRLEAQLGALLDKEISVCFLHQLLIWWPHQQRLAMSGKRKWENTMLCERSVLPRYPDLAKGSDTAVILNLLARCRCAYVGWPALYVYVNHGHNIWDDNHFEGFWSRAEQHFLGEDYLAVIRTLGRHLPIADYLRMLGPLGHDGGSGRDDETIR